MAGVARIPNDIFQYSLHSAYQTGLTSAGPPAIAITGYGSHAIGHAANGAGDLLLLDGTLFILLPDGTVKAPSSGTVMAFVMVTNFQPETSAKRKGLRMDGLGDVFASQGAERGGRNSLMPFSVNGVFQKVVLKGGKVLEKVPGTVFGFGVPSWAYGISGPLGKSVRCCFVDSEMDSPKEHGGFVEDFEISGEAVVQWAVTGRFHLGFPQGEQWQKAKLD